LVTLSWDEAIVKKIKKEIKIKKRKGEIDGMYDANDNNIDNNTNLKPKVKT
jgi:hypothetical protein